MRADQRHAEIILTGPGLEGNSKSVSTPGRKGSENIEDRLGEAQASQYRGLVARANCLSQDKSDIQYAVKELSRTMSSPTVGCWERLKRLGRYLLVRTRVAQSFPYQESPSRLHVYTSSDFAGCIRTRQSSSGGVVMFGKCVIKAWSSTQNVIALSSGEAE